MWAMACRWHSGHFILLFSFVPYWLSYWSHPWANILSIHVLSYTCTGPTLWITDPRIRAFYFQSTSQKHLYFGYRWMESENFCIVHQIWSVNIHSKQNLAFLGPASQILKVKTGAMAWTQNIPLQIVPGWSLPAHGQLSGLRCEELEALFLYWMLKRNLSSHKVAEASTERGKLSDLVFLLRDTT